MAPEQEPVALKRLKKAHQREPFSVCLVGDSDELERAATFEAAMKALGWSLRRRAEKVRGISWVNEKSSADEQIRLFKAIARSIDPDSFLELADDYSFEPVRIEFNGRGVRCRRIDTISEEDDVLEEKDAAEERAGWRPPTFTSIQASMPATRLSYAPTATVTVGDWLEHPTFGPGLVVSAEGSNKARVVFSAGAKILRVGLVQ